MNGTTEFGVSQKNGRYFSYVNETSMFDIAVVRNNGVTFYTKNKYGNTNVFTKRLDGVHFKHVTGKVANKKNKQRLIDDFFAAAEKTHTSLLSVAK